MKRPAMVLIDLDGTMVDSVPDLAWCLDRLMEHLGREPHGEDKVRNWVGNGVERLVKRALIGQLDGEPPAELYEQALPIYLELYADNTSKRSVLYSGVHEGLEFLRGEGFPLACVTNKSSRFSTTLLEDLGILDYFSLVVSGDTLPRRKPDPLPLLHAARHFNVEPGDSLMIGDSINDVQAARAAGFSVVCVPYGYNHGQDIHEAHPDAVIESLAELPALFKAVA